MEEYQKRMVDEYQELLDRAHKLQKFITENPKFDELKKEQRILMSQQLAVQHFYIQILVDRLALEGIKLPLPE